MFEPSKYQQAVFDHVQRVTNGHVTGSGRHLRVDSLAGSGKSTTAKQLLRFIPPNQKVLFTAFNKLIADALAPEVAKLHPNANAQTLHSFGLQTLKANIRPVRVNQYKIEDILQATQFDLSDRVDKALYFRVKNPIKRIISLLKATAAKSIEPKTIEDIIEDYGIEIVGAKTKVIEIVLAVYEMSLATIETHKEVDFDDMVAGPSYLGLQPKQFDWIIVDEFQDFNMAQLNLIMAAKGEHTTIVTFGDPHQAIYGFAGAHTGIMDLFRDGMGATTLPLSVCYRCPTSVLDEARKIVPEIEDAPGARPGRVLTITEDLFEQQVPKHGKPVVLCRFTAPLVSWCLKMIRNGIKATVKGRDIGQNLSALIDKINAGAGIGDFQFKFTAYRADELQRLTRIGREEALDQFRDKMDTIQALSEGEVSVVHIQSKIEKIFSDQEHKDGILFSTIHKFKGSESKCVHILRTKKKARATTPAQIQEETNLNYVAITRSQEVLYYVTPA